MKYKVMMLFVTNVFLVMQLSIGAVEHSSKPTVLPHGVFAPLHAPKYLNEALSENNRFSCTFDTKHSQSVEQQITFFQFFEDGKLVYTMDKVEGVGVQISNSGYMVASRLSQHEGGDLILTFYSPQGYIILHREIPGAYLSGFSKSGNKFYVSNFEKCEIITLPTTTITSYPPAVQCDISDDDTFIALGDEKNVRLYQDSRYLGSINHTIRFFRMVKLSPDNKHVAFIGKNEFFVYGIPGLNQEIFDSIDYDETGFMDLSLSNTHAWVGLHERNRSLNQSRGVLRTYDLTRMRMSAEEVGAVTQYAPLEPLQYKYNNTGTNQSEFPYPLKPFEKPCNNWNSYLQLSASSDGANSSAYCHQGLDFDVPGNAECYSVADGFVKLHMTLSDDLYWRVAVCEVQTADSCEAWLYAHLDKNSIKVKVGDKVKQGDLLGTIIVWPGLAPRGHLHFSRLKGKGETWPTPPRNWKNPAFLLRPFPETTPPKIEMATTDSKFAFSTNDNGTITYQQPDALKGDIDILVKVDSRSGESPWNQAATFIYYSIMNVKTGTFIVPRKLALARAQPMPDYAGDLYNKLAPIMYRVDSKFPVKGWFTKVRTYAHVITNSSGDTAITEADKKNCLSTAKFGDGTYRIKVEVGDPAGHFVVDSQDVTFKNGITETKNELKHSLMNNFSVTQLKNQQVLRFQINQNSTVTIDMLDSKGRTLRRVVSGDFQQGLHSLPWDKTNSLGQVIPSGTYFFVMKTQSFSITKRITIF